MRGMLRPTWDSPVRTEIAMARSVPFKGDEEQSLHVSLDRHRDAVVWKPDCLDAVDGVTGDDQRA